MEVKRLNQRVVELPRYQEVNFLFSKGLRTFLRAIARCGLFLDKLCILKQLDEAGLLDEYDPFINRVVTVVHEQLLNGRS